MSTTTKTALGILIAALISFLGYWQSDLFSTETPQEPTVTVPSDTSTSQAKTMYDVLGVVYTAAHEKQMTAQNPKLGQAAQHARYMANGYRMLDDNEVAWDNLLPATLTDGHVWNNPDNSTKAFLDRIVKIRAVHKGHLTVLAEFFIGENWPYKGPLESEVKGDFDEFGYDITKAVLLTLNELEGTYTYELMGELWKRERLPWRDAYLRGGARAYDEFATEFGADKIKVSTGALQYSNRTISWAGGLLAESIKDYPADVLAIVNKWNGEACINFYPAGPMNEGKPDLEFASPDELKASPDWDELGPLVEYLKANAPNVSLYASEIGYTSAPAHTDETNDNIVKDRDNVAYVLKRAIREGKLTRAYYYSIDGSLGKFKPLSFESDLDWWIEFGAEKLN